MRILKACQALPRAFQPAPGSGGSTNVDGIRKQRFSSVMQNVSFSTNPREKGNKSVFLLCFLQPCWAVGRSGGLGKKYTKSGDAILVIQQPRPGHCSLPGWVGWVGLGLPLLLLAKSGGKKTRRKKLDASDTAAQSEGVQCSHMKSS